MKKIKQFLLQLLYHIVPFWWYRNGSYSQDGEDMVLNAFYETHKNYKGFYVDVGAHHPFRFSNTAFFYKKGWRGINIEATPTLMKAFRVFRKRDINLNIAVGLSEKPLKFFTFNEPALNGFDEELSQQRNQGRYQIVDTIEIAPKKLSCILDQHLPKGQKIDFMSIDVEGVDLDVLKSNDWEKYAPNYLLVEGALDFENVTQSEIYCYLNQLSYKLVAKTQRTCIFQNISLLPHT